MRARRAPMIGVLLSAVVAGCASSPPSSTGPAPSVTTPTTEPGSGSSGSPDPGRGETLAAAFLGRIQDPSARYRFDETYTLVIGEGSPVVATSHTDVAGADLMIITDRTADGATTHGEYLQVGGAAFERSGDEDWRAVDLPGERQAPFVFLETTNIRYGGLEIKGGALLESLSLAEAIPIGGALADSIGVMGGSSSIVIFDCFLQGDGSPVLIEVGIQINGADGNAAGYSTIVQEYTEFGGDVVVAPPIG